jgi:GNAT superfamily N-acetyltransferase
MKNPLRFLLPRSEQHLLMGRLAPSSEAPSTAAGVEILTIHRPADPAVAMLDTFAATHGFPAGWASEMLADGARAMVARDPGNGDAMAMAWNTGRAFHVDEIGATLDPGEGVYFFGDFVAPRYRGRKLQRLLISKRLAAIEDRAFACTLVHPSNAASVRSYTEEGFAIGGRYVRYRWRRKTWGRCKCAENAPIVFELRSPEIVFARRA